MENLRVEYEMMGGAEDGDEETEGGEAPEGAGKEVGEAVATDAVDGEAATLDAAEEEGGQREARELEDAGDEGVVGGDVGDRVGRGGVRPYVMHDAGELAGDGECGNDEEDGKDDGERDVEHSAPTGAKAEAAEEDGIVRWGGRRRWGIEALVWEWS